MLTQQRFGDKGLFLNSRVVMVPGGGMKETREHTEVLPYITPDGRPRLDPQGGINWAPTLSLPVPLQGRRCLRPLSLRAGLCLVLWEGFV